MNNPFFNNPYMNNNYNAMNQNMLLNNMFQTYPNNNPFMMDNWINQFNPMMNSQNNAINQMNMMQNIYTIDQNNKMLMMNQMKLWEEMNTMNQTNKINQMNLMNQIETISNYGKLKDEKKEENNSYKVLRLENNSMVCCNENGKLLTIKIPPLVNEKKEIPKNNYSNNNNNINKNNFIKNEIYNPNLNNNMYINIDSKILENKNQYKTILIEWLKKPNENNNIVKNIRNIILLYRGSRDGFRAKNFHEKCNYKGETLTIIQSKEGYIFGGYTEINWDNTSWNKIFGIQNNSRREGRGNEFVFTLKNPYNIPPCKFNMKREWLGHSICCEVKRGPIFGCNDIRIEDNCNVNYNTFQCFDFKPGEFSFNDTTGKQRLLFTGNYTYLVHEIEVFNILR